LNHSDTEKICHQKRVFQPDTALSFCLRNKYIHPATEINGCGNTVASGLAIKKSVTQLLQDTAAADGGNFDYNRRNLL
jgi:hypothetical protein